MKPDSGPADLERLAELACALLPRMRSDQTGLFSHKAHLNGGDLVNQGENALYSAMSLIGVLHHAETAVGAPEPDPGRTLDSLHSRVTPGSPLSLVGTLVWA